VIRWLLGLARAVVLVAALCVALPVAVAWVVVTAAAASIVAAVAFVAMMACSDGDDDDESTNMGGDLRGGVRALRCGIWEQIRHDWPRERLREVSGRRPRREAFQEAQPATREPLPQEVAMTWIVRLGTERGRGAYVREVYSAALTGSVLGAALSTRQRLAQRFSPRAVAEAIAYEFGGRVVRLRSAASVGDSGLRITGGAREGSARV
jgi:hypothetical protein